MYYMMLDRHKGHEELCDELNHYLKGNLQNKWWELIDCTARDSRECVPCINSSHGNDFCRSCKVCSESIGPSRWWHCKFEKKLNSVRRQGQDKEVRPTSSRWHIRLCLRRRTTHSVWTKTVRPQSSRSVQFNPCQPGSNDIMTRESLDWPGRSGGYWATTSATSSRPPPLSSLPSLLSHATDNR